MGIPEIVKILELLLETMNNLIFKCCSKEVLGTSWQDKNKIWAGGNIQQVILKHHVEAIVIFISCIFGLFLHFGKNRASLTFGRKTEEKLKLIWDGMMTRSLQYKKRFFNE